MKTKSIQVIWRTIVLSAILTVRAISVPVSATGFTFVLLPWLPDSLPAVTLRAASGASISFQTQNGDTVDDIPPQSLTLPHLVLYRNGRLTQASERTLIVELIGIEVPASGVTVTLQIETQHGDPDARGDMDQRMSVWQVSQWIANASDVLWTGVTAVFVHEFGATVASGSGTTTTPTDYYRYEVTVTDADHPRTNPLYALSRDYAFLMESQWVARLPEVGEESPGAAPDELVVYYADMFPFRKDANDPSAWLPREEVTAYVGAELLPHMVETFRVQTDEWGFPWYQAWTSRRPGDGKRLGVALSDGETWYHGPAPARGLSDISINVSGGMPEYDPLAEGLMSVFHHELFHNLQRNISLYHGGDGRVNGKESAWKFFAEGTAVLASSLGQPDVEFALAQKTRTYVSFANRFVVCSGGRFQDLIANYQDMSPYYATIYWRFLYEQCGGMQGGVQDQAAGMSVIRSVLTALYAGEIVDIDASTDLLSATPKILDRALAGSLCPFQTYEESMVAFARAIYGLRLAGGRCVEPGLPAGCGFYDPHALYDDPTVDTLVFDGTAREYRRKDGMSPFDTDWIEIDFGPAAKGNRLTLEFRVPPAAGAKFDVQFFRLAGAGPAARSQYDLFPPASTEACTEHIQDGLLVCAIPEIRLAAHTRLGLIITRLDSEERSDLTGKYILTLRPSDRAR